MAIVELPTLHVDQVKAYRLPGRFKAIRCGRRWGKTVYGEVIGCNGAAWRQRIGWFAPQHKYLTETFADVADILSPIKMSSSKVEGTFRTTTGGQIDFWTLENDRAGRGRRYHKVIIDEAAFTGENMIDIWNKSIKPTLLDYVGSATVLSNTNGDDPTNFLWRICNEPEHGFVEYHAPSHNNPYLPSEELAKLERENHPLVYAQEYLAKFVSWAGVAFFGEDSLLVNKQPVEMPRLCDQVFAVIDTAVKAGKEHDATAVSYWAASKHIGIPLVCLDWDIISIDGALLETWIPNVFRRLEELAKECKARVGSGGVWIEDAQSGSILLQQCANRNWPAHPLPAALTAAGKDGRALNVSSQVYQGKVKFSRPAYEKTSSHKGQTRNHMWAQVVGFRIGDKQAATRSDDALDTFCYAVAIALGNSEGFG